MSNELKNLDQETINGIALQNAAKAIETVSNSLSVHLSLVEYIEEEEFLFELTAMINEKPEAIGKRFIEIVNEYFYNKEREKLKADHFNNYAHSVMH